MDTIIDEEALLTLKEVMEDEFQLLIDTFIADAPQRLGDLKTALDSGDSSDLEKPAHTLKGSSSNIGALQLAACCAELVNQIRAGAVADPAASVAEIESAYERLKPVLLSYI